MTLECINPEDLLRPETYTQVVVAKGTRLVFVSGQEPIAPSKFRLCMEG